METVQYNTENTVESPILEPRSKRILLTTFKHIIVAYPRCYRIGFDNKAGGRNTKRLARDSPHGATSTIGVMGVITKGMVSRHEVEVWTYLPLRVSAGSCCK